MEYQIEINMAEPVFDTKPIWQPCEDAHFETRAQAEAMVRWMKKEYGDAIEFRIVEKEVQ